MTRTIAFAVLLLTVLLRPTALLAETGARVLATGGVSQIEGAAGGGLTPWALIAGYGTKDQVGVTAFSTRADPTDFELWSAGVAVGVFDRVEVSFARQELGLGTTVPNQSISQDVVGIKVRVIGDAVFDQDRWLPQIAVGLQWKHNRDMDVPKALGAKDGTGVDFYVAATKLWLGAVFGRNLLLSGTLRATRANQLGLLGFGGDLNDSYQLMPEVSGGLFLTDALVLGAEYRRKPNNLSAFPEDSFKDVYLAWIPNKHFSVTGAYLNLGQIADKLGQRALYVSIQLAY